MEIPTNIPDHLETRNYIVKGTSHYDEIKKKKNTK